MTADYIAFHAQQRPDAAAFLDDGHRVTYNDLARDIRKFTRAMREFEIPQGGTVVVGCDNPHLHLLILLACERLGLTTTSLVGREPPTVLPLLDAADLLISEFPPPPEARPRLRHEITQAWVDGVKRLPDAEEAPLPLPPAESALRILRTSGTTGTPKRLYLTRRMFDCWTNRWIWLYGLGVRSRVMAALPFVIGGGYAQVCACLRAGGTVVRENRMEVAQALSHYSVDLVVLLPVFLREVLAKIPAGFGRVEGLVVAAFGGAIQPSLRAEAVARLCGAVSDMYGCNEVGFIGSSGLYRAGGHLDVWPGVAVEVTDDQDRPLPPGQLGRIRVRTESMFAGYIDDPEATRRMLREGWFYPGDVGVLHGPRSLELQGRGDDILNFEGHKFMPEPLEEMIRKRVRIPEFAVGADLDADGAPVLCVAVAETGIVDAELETRIAAVLSHAGFRKFELVRVPSIPRNVGGKVQRHLLKAEIAAARQGPLRE